MIKAKLVGGLKGNLLKSKFWFTNRILKIFKIEEFRAS
jgi:hypothetical protein